MDSLGLKRTLRPMRGCYGYNSDGSGGEGNSNGPPGPSGGGFSSGGNYSGYTTGSSSNLGATPGNVGGYSRSDTSGSSDASNPDSVADSDIATPAPTVPAVFNPAKDSQLANEQLGLAPTTEYTGSITNPAPLGKPVSYYINLVTTPILGLFGLVSGTVPGVVSGVTTLSNYFSGPGVGLEGGPGFSNPSSNGNSSQNLISLTANPITRPVAEPLPVSTQPSTQPGSRNNLIALLAAGLTLYVMG